MSSQRAALAVTGLAFATIMIDGFDLQALGFLAPEIARTWSIPLGAFGLVFAATLAGSIPGAALAGFVVRAVGLRNALAVCLALFGTMTLAAAWATDVQSLAVLRFIAGIGLGAAIPVAMSVLADNLPPHIRTSLTTIALCGQPLGAIAGSAVCAHFVPIQGWRFGFLLGGTLPLLLIPVVLVSLRRPTTAGDSVPATAETRVGQLFEPALLPLTLLLWISVLLASSCLNLVVNWLPGEMRVAGATLQMSILAVSLFNFGGIIGALCAAIAIDRFGYRSVMPPLFAGAAIGALALGLASSGALLCGAAALTGMTGYAGAVLLGPLAVARYPQPLRTFGVGWMLGVGRAGATASSWLAGAVVTAGAPIGRLFWFASAAYLIVMLVLRRLADRERPARPGRAAHPMSRA